MKHATCIHMYSENNEPLFNYCLHLIAFIINNKSHRNGSVSETYASIKWVKHTVIHLQRHFIKIVQIWFSQKNKTNTPNECLLAACHLSSNLTHNKSTDTNTLVQRTIVIFFSTLLQQKKKIWELLQNMNMQHKLLQTKNNLSYMWSWLDVQWKYI